MERTIKNIYSIFKIRLTVRNRLTKYIILSIFLLRTILCNIIELAVKLTN